VTANVIRFKSAAKKKLKGTVVKLLMLVNPHAGRKRGKIVAEKSLAAFQHKGINVSSRYSEHPGHLIEIAKQEVHGDWDGIIVVGGDGSLFEVINGMMTGNELLPIPIGVLPVGTGNSFSRDLAIQNLDQAIQKIIDGKTRNVDLGKCACRERVLYFINILGFGFVSDVAQKASLYKQWGNLSYVLGVFIITQNLQSYHLDIEIDGRSFQRENIFVEICNSTKTGGDMIMAPQAQIDDGFLDVVLLNKTSRTRLLSALPKIFKGTHLQMEEVETFRAKEMQFRPNVSKVLTPDGEITGHTPIAVSVLPGKIRVFGAVNEK
jgi:diacylglycerol kinase (ATP)